MNELEALRQGIQDGELFLEYQPIVELESGRCTGAEALVRWRRATGVVQPADFIPLIEDTPLSGMLTYWVIEQLAEELGDWLRHHPDASLAIDGEAPSWLVELTNLSRSTELKIIAEGVETAVQAQALREAGIALAQGFHFSRPLSAGSFRAYFAEHS